MGFKTEGPDKIDGIAYAYGSSARSVLTALESGDLTVHAEDPGWSRSGNRYKISIVIENAEDTEGESLSW